MAAHSSGDGDFQHFVSLDQGLSAEFEGRRGINAAGAAYEELSLILGVKVNQGFTVEKAFFEGEGSVHPGFFGNSEEAFQFSAGGVGIQ